MAIVNLCPPFNDVTSADAIIRQRSLVIKKQVADIWLCCGVKTIFQRVFVVRTWNYIVFILCCLLLSTAIAEDKPLDWTKLFARDVVTEVIKTRDNVPGVKASFCVKSTPEHIWSVLTGYSYFPKIYKGLKKANVRMSSNVGAEVEYVYLVNFLGIFNKELDYVISDQYSPSHRRIVWERVSGDLERIEGSWEIIDTQRHDTYLLEYCSYVKPPWYIPASLVQSKAINEVKEMANAIRTWTEGNGQ